MRTLLDDVFDELIDDLNKWHKKYTNNSDVKLGLEDLKDIMNDYSNSSDSEIRQMENNDGSEWVDDYLDYLRTNE